MQMPLQERFGRKLPLRDDEARILRAVSRTAQAKRELPGSDSEKKRRKLSRHLFLSVPSRVNAKNIETQKVFSHGKSVS